MSLKRTVKNINRIREVIRILVKHSFEDIVTRTGLNRFLTPQGRIRISSSDPIILRHSLWERVRLVVEELGPTFIKFAQLLSNRPDILPDDLIKEFEKLQNEVPHFPTKTAIAIVEQELGKPIHELFSFFDNIPVGSASIGQVHRARLLDGQDVVVKVQRPNVRDKVLSDLALLHQIISLTSGYFETHGVLNPVEVVETFEKTMIRELDYLSEARNIEQFRHLYHNEKSFYIPKAYRQFSTSRVLVIEFVSGCKISDLPQLERWGLSPQKVAEHGIDIYLKQMFVHGLFHADPHPGNVLVRPNGQVVLIDFGMVGRLSSRQKYALASVMIGMMQRDARSMATNLRRLASGHAINSHRAFEHDLEELIEDFVVVNVDQMGVADFIGRLQQIVYRYKLQLPGSIFLMLRALAIIEGVGQVLHPQFDTLDFLKPYGIELMKEQYTSKHIKNELQYTVSQLLSLLYTSPIDLKQILKQLRKGEFKTNQEIVGLSEFHRTFNHIANKLLATLLIAALTIGSSIALLARYEGMSYVFGMPVVSFVGYSLAFFIGLMLLFSIRRD